MTKEDWAKAEEMLSGIYGHVELKIDGYNVTVEKRKISEMKLCLAIFIDGVFKMEWAIEECDIRRRFCHRSKKSLLTKKELDKLKKKVGKRAFERALKEKPELFGYVYYEPFFSSFRTLKSQLVQNNVSIEFAKSDKG